MKLRRDPRDKEPSQLCYVIFAVNPPAILITSSPRDKTPLLGAPEPGFGHVQFTGGTGDVAQFHSNLDWIKLVITTH